MSYRSIEFGFASAEEESAQAADLVRHGYLDSSGLTTEAIRGKRYLFLGYKGSGKTAIGQRLRVLAESDSLLFVQNVFLDAFPYSTFAKIVPGSMEPEARYPSAWKWLLVLELLKSLMQDEGAEAESALELDRLASFLEKTGMLATDELKHLVLISSKKSFKAKIPQLFEGGVEHQYEGVDLQFSQLVTVAQRVLMSFRSKSRHLLVIDGLDDILTAREVQLHALSALLIAASRLNMELAQSGASAKVIILCRTDLFERLPGANKNKLRRDVGVELNWYHDTRTPKDSQLYALADLRAKRSIHGLTGVLDDFFPSELDGRSTAKFLLDLTRHTPRDFLQLLKCIQEFAEGGRLSRSQILSGARQYSLDYFLPELRDELDGHLSEQGIVQLFEVLGALGKREFTLAQLTEAATQAGSLDESLLRQSLRVLFGCSGIGNASARPSGTKYFSFKYRNRNSVLDLNAPLVIHSGAWKALNLI